MPTEHKHAPAAQPWRARMHEVIFEADTPAGKAFDILLILSIFASVGAVVLDSIAAIHNEFGKQLWLAECIFTGFFSIEYGLRLWCVRRPARYAKSFFGVVDLIAVLPTYINLLFPGTHYLATVRILRVLRVFRVLKLVQYIGEAELIVEALRASRRRIFVFIFAVMTLVVVLGSMMYVIEGSENGFESIPAGIYWAVVTLTTVGYGDISPQTPMGQALSVIVMLLGYSIIAVPTGIVSVEFSRERYHNVNTQACPSCGAGSHAGDAVYCRKCGTALYS